MKYFITIVSLVIFFVGCSATKGVEREVGSLSSVEEVGVQKGYYPAKDEIEFQNLLRANKDNWCQVLKDAPERSTILLEDGEYTDYCAVKNKSYITIKAENKYGVTYTGDNFFLTLQDKNHHINLLGIEATTTTDTFGSGLLKVHGYANYDNHHIYVADCWVHHSGSAILTSPRNHDITVDRCLIHDIKMGYYWYAMGWHLTLSNSVLYHPENNGMVIRGHFPLNRYWDFKEAKTADVTKEEGLENIAEDDWTHYVVGNFFGEGYGRNAQRSWERGSAISFYIGRDNHDEDDAYLAPQNVVIEDNMFYNITPSVAPTGDIYAGAITVDGEAGFSYEKTDAVDGLITGTILRNNTSNVQLIKPFWNPDLSLIEEQNNRSWDSRVLEKEFLRRIDKLQSNTY